MEIASVDEIKAKTVSTFLHYPYLFIIGIFIIASVFLWNDRQSKTKEIVSLKSSIAIQASIAETTAQLDAMKKRQEELYPVLQKTWDDLKVANDALDKAKNDI